MILWGPAGISLMRVSVFLGRGLPSKEILPPDGFEVIYREPVWAKEKSRFKKIHKMRRIKAKGFFIFELNLFFMNIFFMRFRKRVFQ